jgi:hypothetical protein
MAGLSWRTGDFRAQVSSPTLTENLYTAKVFSLHQAAKAILAISVAPDRQ